MWHTVDGMGWWMLLGGFWMVIFWGAIIWLAVWGIGQATGGSRRNEDNPLEIARTRYARGEITREQFEQLQQDLRR